MVRHIGAVRNRACDLKSICYWAAVFCTDASIQIITDFNGLILCHKVSLHVIGSLVSRGPWNKFNDVV